MITVFNEIIENKTVILSLDKIELLNLLNEKLKNNYSINDYMDDQIFDYKTYSRLWLYQAIHAQEYVIYAIPSQGTREIINCLPLVDDWAAASIVSWLTKNNNVFEKMLKIKAFL